MTTQPTGTCPTCTGTFALNTGPGPDGRYCTPNCRSRANARRRAGKPIADSTPPAGCLVCTGSLTYRKHGARYCSKRCSNVAYLRRRDAAAGVSS